MDKEKTGKLIARVRKNRNMTQQDLAEQLHVTSKAVSKWERGLSFPGVDILEALAGALDISVMDILAGEIIEVNVLTEKSAEVSLQVMRQGKKNVKRTILVCITAAILLCCFLFFRIWGPAIFQRGNPIPYLIAAAQLSERSFAEVDEGSIDYIYITRAGDSEALLRHIEAIYHAEFMEQAGSGYIFTTGTEHFTLSSEIYWGRYIVWTMSGRTFSTE